MNRRLSPRSSTGKPVPLAWRGDTRGAAAVEFALLLPVLVALYLGGFETLRLVSTYRKVCDTTAQLANITAYSDTVAKADLQISMAAAAQIMAPYSTSKLEIVASEIQVVSSSSATVTWSQAWKGGSAYPAGEHAKGSTWTLPPALAAAPADTYYILVQTSYAYTTLLGGHYIGFNIPLANQLYMSPRSITKIKCTDC
jgi:Flp pilus assembly protein TadG